MVPVKHAKIAEQFQNTAIKIRNRYIFAVIYSNMYDFHTYRNFRALPCKNHLSWAAPLAARVLTAQPGRDLPHIAAPH
jgi:hypothetical protein